jgi:hypothetical protein
MSRERAFVVVAGTGVEELNRFLEKGAQVKSVHALGAGSAMSAWLVVADEAAPASKSDDRPLGG